MQIKRNAPVGDRGKFKIKLIGEITHFAILTTHKSRDIFDFPKVERLADGLCNAQHCSNSGLFYFMPFPCRIRREYKLAQRPVTVRSGGLSTTGERCAFLFFNPQK